MLTTLGAIPYPQQLKTPEHASKSARATGCVNKRSDVDAPPGIINPQRQQWLTPEIGKVSEGKPGALNSWDWKGEAYFVREPFQSHEGMVPGLAAASADEWRPRSKTSTPKRSSSQTQLQSPSTAPRVQRTGLGSTAADHRKVLRLGSGEPRS